METLGQLSRTLVSFKSPEQAPTPSYYDHIFLLIMSTYGFLLKLNIPSCYSYKYMGSKYPISQIRLRIDCRLAWRLPCCLEAAPSYTL